MAPISIKRLAITAAMLCFAGTASAQYIWLDDKGGKQFSDMPPPSSVPKARILKSPGFKARSASESAADNTAGGTGDSGKPKAPMTYAEKNMEFQKRRIEQAEKDKKAADAQKADIAKVKNCERARNYSQSLASGSRLVRRDKNGEAIPISDEERAKELREATEQLSDCK